MKKINLAITGCMGRMGQQIIKSARLDKDFKIVTLTESKKIKKKISGIQIDQNNSKAFKKADLIIDFTIPKCTFQVLDIASKLKKKDDYWNNRFYQKGRKIDQKIFKKNSNFKSRKYEFGYQFVNVFN